MGARAVPFVDAGLFDAVGCRMTEKRKGKSLRFALSAALLYAGALACCSLFACMSADARGRGGAFIPRSAARGGAEHPPVPLSSLKDPSLADASTFENVKPDCIDTACVACHVNRGLNLALPPVRTPDGKPGPAYYLGGESGTVFNSTTKAFEQPSPAIEKAGLTSRFLAGEAIFEGNFVADPHVPFGGLGPTYMKTSCLSCHPGYGRGRRTGNFRQEYGNGYIAAVHRPDGSIVEGYTQMLHIFAVAPYKPYAKDVKITWKPFVDKYGNTYPDGTKYNAGKPTEGQLTYPVADIVEPLLPLPDDYRVSIESTIGIYGTGLLDAIDDSSIIGEYDRQHSFSGPVKGSHGKWLREAGGRMRVGRFTWHCDRATLENGPGSNGLYNTTNVARSDRPFLYATPQWIAKQRELGLDTSAFEGRQRAELSQKDFEDFMIWHRGLAVPAARNLDRPEVARGRKIFYEIGCASCHKPEWKTGEYAHIPAYSGQTIRPYTDLLMHDMGDENVGRFRTYRTPPLWGRGLMRKAADHTDMFHDLRARDFEEAILWHFGEAEFSRELFRKLSAGEREDLIRFLRAL